MISSQTKHLIKSTIVTILLLAGVGFVAAQPTGNPPSGGNPAVPLHVGVGVVNNGVTYNQYKAGPLRIGSASLPGSGRNLEVTGPTTLNIDPSCITTSGCSSGSLVSGHAAMSTSGLINVGDATVTGLLLIGDPMTNIPPEANLDMSGPGSLRSRDLENGGQGGRVCADPDGKLVICS